MAHHAEKQWQQHQTWARLAWGVGTCRSPPPYLGPILWRRRARERARRARARGVVSLSSPSGADD